jgi:hypothetical protein
LTTGLLSNDNMKQLNLSKEKTSHLFMSYSKVYYPLLDQQHPSDIFVTEVLPSILMFY